MAEDQFPLYPTAVVVPLLAFPAWILCIPPLYWHFSQRNIAAGSLILWLSVLNFFNSINALIWPRDNVHEWWNGIVLCDIQVHVHAGGVVALTSCTAVILRKLAKVMDTSNITVSPSRASRIKEKTFEIIWCWGFPLFLMAIYYIVQSSRYYIFAISGCVAAYDASWPSIVLAWMWGPITAFVASYYAGLLIFRLFRYRREFHRLISARNTTKSRFLRLFLMSLLFITVFLPYNLYILYVLSSAVEDSYDWDLIHGEQWHIIPMIPTQGVVRWDRWAQIASGYIMFLSFGTGTDAHNTYKRLLCTVGLGKIFPSLYRMRESGSSTPSSVSFVKGFASSCASKAKSFFSKSDSVTKTMASTRTESICLETPTTNRSGHLTRIETNEPMLPQGGHVADTSSNSGSFFTRIFGRRNRQHSLLPIFATRPVDQMTTMDKSPVETIPPGVHARAWATESSAADRHGVDDGVHVIREVHLAHHKDKGTQKEEPYVSDWA